MVNEFPLRYIYRGSDEAGVFAYAIGQGDTDGLMTPCPGNTPPDSGPYICLVPVLDFWRMNAQLARKENAWHYADGIETKILSDVRAGRCAIVFDLCNEGVPYDATIFGDLYHWIESHRIPPGKVVWLDQNRSIAVQAEAMSGSVAQLVRFEQYDFFVKMMAQLFSPKSLETILSVEPGVFVERMYDGSRKDKMLLCLNATPRLWRVLVVGSLMHYGLLENSLVSFPGMSGYAKEHESSEKIRQFVDTSPSLEYLSASVESVLHMSALKIDNFTDRGDSLYAKIDVSVYERSYFSLVTETDFTDGSVSRITEKLVKPFCLGHPTLIVGNPHSLQFMSDLGFESWAGVIDGSYDLESDPLKRFALLLQEVQRQVNGIRQDSREWLGRAREVGAANINHSMSGQFLRRYRDRYDIPLVSRLARVVGL